MSKQEIVCHPGRIASIDGNTLHVLILAQSACSSCHAKGACGMLDMQEKMVDVQVSNPTDFSINEEVNVSMKQSAGNKAVFFGYFLPLLLVLVTLIVSLQLTADEALSGLIAISILAPYYLALYLLRDRLTGQFRFFVEKLREY